MPDATARLNLPYILPSQAQKHVTHNEALQRLDVITQLTVAAFDAETPPAAPEDGVAYALGLAPGGAWAGEAGKIAFYSNGAWMFITPAEGWRAWGVAEAVLQVYQGGAWGPAQVALQNLDGIGVQTTSDATNRFAVSSEASLLTHAGAGHQLKINKAAAGDTASLLYQSNWVGHAEMGLAGDTDFHLKVSADGSAWTEALVVDGASGHLTGAAVQASGADASAGRLVKLFADSGVFGLGLDSTAAPISPGDDLDALTLSGIYRFGAGTTGAPATDGVVLHLGQVAGGYVQQAQGADGRMFTRGQTGASWAPWAQVYDSSSVLGTVAQSGGVPTGAAFESGNNGNGYYVRFADGTQLCQHSRGLFVSGAATWVFPSAFASPPKVFGSLQTTTVSATLANEEAPTATNAKVSMQSSSNGRMGGTVDLMAIGRWF